MIIFLKKIFGLVSSFLIIYACLLIGKYLAGFLPFVFPGSIIGLLILFVLLEIKAVKINWVMPSGSLFLKYMALLFMPAAVGVISHLNEVYSSIVLIIFNIVSGVALIILVVGRMFQHFSETPEERRRRKLVYRRALRYHRNMRRKFSHLNTSKQPAATLNQEGE